MSDLQNSGFVGGCSESASVNTANAELMREQKRYAAKEQEAENERKKEEQKAIDDQKEALAGKSVNELEDVQAENYRKYLEFAAELEKKEGEVTEEDR